MLQRLPFTIAAAFLIQLTPHEVPAQEQVWKAADGVYRYGSGYGYYSMFVVTNDGVIVVEPVSTAHSQGMLKAIGDITDKPVRYLLHSHNHWDHSKGGQVWCDQGATIVAHTDAVAWMKANPHPDLALPDEVLGWKAEGYRSRRKDD